MLGLIRPHRKLLGVFALIILAEAAAGVSVPLLFRVVVDDGITAGSMHVVLWASGAIAAVGLGQQLMQYGTRWCADNLCESVLYTLRIQLFEHLSRLPMSFFSRAHTGAITARLGTDLVECQAFFTATMANALSNTAALVLTVAAMASLNWKVTLLVLPLIPFCLLASRLVGRKLQRLTREAFVVGTELSSMTAERASVGGAHLAALYSSPADSLAAYELRAGRVRKAFFRKHITTRLLALVLGSAGAISIAAVYAAGGVLAVNGTLQTGVVVALALLVTKVYAPVTALTQVRVEAMSSVVAFERVFEVMDLSPLVVDSPEAAAATAVRGQIRFDDVHFRYPAPAKVSLPSLENRRAPLSTVDSDRVLNGVSFTAEPGQTVAFVGPSGAGKSTLSYLVSRLYDPTGGRVLLDGVDLRNLTLDSVRSSVGVVSQDPHMFHDTLRVNLSLGDPMASDEVLLEAMRKARVDHVLKTLPDGLDTAVGERGAWFDRHNRRYTRDQADAMFAALVSDGGLEPCTRVCPGARAFTWIRTGA